LLTLKYILCKAFFPKRKKNTKKKAHNYQYSKLDEFVSYYFDMETF